MSNQVTQEYASNLDLHTHAALNEEPTISQASSHDDQIVLSLAGTAIQSACLIFDLRRIEELASATVAQRKNFVVSPGGAAIRWPEIGFGLTAHQLIERVTGLESFSTKSGNPTSPTSETKARAVQTQGDEGRTAQALTGLENVILELLKNGAQSLSSLKEAIDSESLYESPVWDDAIEALQSEGKITISSPEQSQIVSLKTE